MTTGTWPSNCSRDPQHFLAGVHGFHHRATRLMRRRSVAEQSVDVFGARPREAHLVPVRRPFCGGGSGVDQGGEDDGVGFVVLGFFVEGSPAGDQT